MKKENKLKYAIKQNNYVGLLFFALVFASLLYLIKENTKELSIPEPTNKAIETIDIKRIELTEETDEIKHLRSYLNKGDSNTFKIYQSMYNFNEKITIDNIDEETMLYLAYKYIEKNNDFSNTTKYLTCQEAEIVGIDNQIIQCNGHKTNLSNYTVNSYITKEILSQTIQKLFNRKIYNYTNFYTSLNNLCYYVANSDYICIKHNNETKNSVVESEFIKAYKYNTKIEIIEKYKHIVNGIYYKGFNSKEIGEGTYISTFTKINGIYYWQSTEMINED